MSAPVKEWVHQDSNLEPTRYEQAALPLSYRPEAKQYLMKSG